ncbi:SRPBCC family protein [Planosporangium flavigriseum]|uniref:Cyclase n=1 Tax=Planosporangium flavigriseum TaxID=373681 RepID=A0A8J3LJF5_9ACTN|nr:SRPBCC family protein [Planosporangium flavigriseum]NJC63983.1 SRPBCC family protein [Planosporangium flavigriseum]GIG72862.1 cyclase [Planosporangium flavigriseum]
MSEASSPLADLGRALRDNPAMARLGREARDYALARANHLVDNLIERLNEGGDGGGLKAALVGVRGLAEGKSPMRAGISAAMTGLTEKVKSALGGGEGGGKPKVTHISEDIDIGLPVDVVYNQWTQYGEFAKFMKGVEGVDRISDTETTWRVKVFKSRRTWKAVTQEQIPDRRIVWTSEGAKGSTKGVVTFHPLADDLTRVLLVMEYYPQGLFEKTGNLWRAGGRRARLDLKNFRRFVTLNGEATGAWRGEIRDSEVVHQPEEAEWEEVEQGDQEPPTTPDDRTADDEDDEDDEYEYDEDEYDDDADDEDDSRPVSADSRGSR